MVQHLVSDTAQGCGYFVSHAGYQPVHGFQEIPGFLINGRGMVQGLQYFRYGPFGGDLIAVGSQPGFVSFFCDAVDILCFSLGTMMFPQFDIGMRFIPELFCHAQGNHLFIYGQNCSGGKVQTDADDLFGQDTAFLHDTVYAFTQGCQVILGVLQCISGGQRLSVQFRVHDTMRVGIYTLCRYFPILQIQQDSAGRECAKVQTKSILMHVHVLLTVLFRKHLPYQHISQTDQDPTAAAASYICL